MEKKLDIIQQKNKAELTQNFNKEKFGDDNLFNQTKLDWVFSSRFVKTPQNQDSPEERLVEKKDEKPSINPEVKSTSKPHILNHK